MSEHVDSIFEQAGDQRKRSEREETIEYLVEKIGLSREDAELRMVDDDLWVLYPECRYEFPVGEKSVRQWRDAVSALESLSIAVEFLDNGALQHVFRHPSGVRPINQWQNLV